MVKIILSTLLLLTTVTYAKEYTTMKTSCIQQSEHAGKTLDDQKTVLIDQAKQLALTDLYGEMIFSKVDLENGKITSEEIRQRAVGAVRLKGNPSFYNGKNFGEVCADVTAYVTDKDIEKFSPKKVSLDKYCFNDPSVAMKDIKKQAKYGAYKEIISQFKPSLKLTGKQAESLIHGFKISNDNFDFDTASYCFDAVGTVLPYELEVSQNNNTNTNKSNKLSCEESKEIIGLSVTVPSEWDSRYTYDKMIDNNLETGWWAGKSSKYNETWARIDLPFKQIVDKLNILNGFPPYWYGNPRIKTLKLTFDNGSSQVVELEDNIKSMQMVNINPIETKTLLLEFIDIYPSNKFQAVGINELQIFGCKR